MVRVFITLLLSTSAFAINGIITVLEAPIFGEPDESAPVIQYYRKGENIYLHPQEAEQKVYQAKDFKYLEVIKPDIYKDPMIEKPYRPKKENKFYKTLARSGREAYVLKEHVYIEYKDAREMEQEVISFDHTDYRIEEPLPRNYPFISEQDYRGQFMLALGQPNFDPYPYRQQVLDQSLNLTTELSFSWLKIQKIDPRRRFMFGAIGGFNLSRAKYVLTTQTATQSNFRLFLGPHASYDFYRSPKHRFALYLNTQVYLLDQMDISINDNAGGASEKRQYSSRIGISPNLGGHFKWLNYWGSMNLVLGANLRASLPRNYQAAAGARESRLWRDRGQDTYYQSFMTEISYVIGIENNY